MSSRESYLKDIALRLRVHCIKSINAAKSGHVTSCASLAEIMSVLFFDTMRYRVKEPKHPASDRLILSKGHAAPILYASWAEAGLFPIDRLANLRKFDDDLEGHPTPRLNFIDVGTGSLGQGLGISAGMAYCGKYYDKSDYRVYCILGDGEMAEGSNWEALAFASTYNLDNLCAIIDVNRLGQSGRTALGHDLETYKNRLVSFGFESFVVDGHDVNALCEAFEKAKLVTSKPQAIICKTFKGKDLPGVEDKENWHGKPLGSLADSVLPSLEKQILGLPIPNIPEPTATVPNVSLKVSLSKPPKYEKGEKVATRKAYGTAIVKLGESNDRIIALDGETSNSTFSEALRFAYPQRFIECFIAEQNMVSVGVGLSCRDRCIPFVSTFSCFLTRAFDQIRMGAISRANVKFVGSHCGVSIGEDGPSQMGLEDIAMFRSVPKCNVFYPSDAVATERAVELAAQHYGMDYVRTSRPATEIIYKNDEVFEIGKAKVVRSSEAPQCVIIGAGVTLFESLKAADLLKTSHNISVSVIDPFTIKPLDAETIKQQASNCKKVLVVEDHYPEGGIGEAVASALATTDIVMKHLAIREIAKSGPPQTLIDHYGIGSETIVKTVKEFLN